MRSECGVNNIHLCVISTLQADAGDIIMWRLFSWHILDPVGPNGHYLSTTAYLSILADLIYAFVTTISKSPDFCFQQDNTPCHQSLTISHWFPEHDSSNGLHYHQTPIQRSTIWMWWNGRYASWMWSWQISSNCVMLSHECRTKSLRNASVVLLNLCHQLIRY